MWLGDVIWATDEWDNMTNKVLDLEQLPVSDMEELIKDTYEILIEYSKDELVPKEIAKLLLRIRHFVEMASAIEFNEKEEGFYYAMDILAIEESMQKVFFEGKYDCEFPKIQIKDINDNVHIINLENSFLPLK